MKGMLDVMGAMEGPMRDYLVLTHPLFSEPWFSDIPWILEPAVKTEL